MDFPHQTGISAELIPSHTQPSEFCGGNIYRKSWNSLVQNHRT